MDARPWGMSRLGTVCWIRLQGRVYIRHMYFNMNFSFARGPRARILAAILVLAPFVGAGAQPARSQQLETRAALTDRAARAEKEGRRAYAAVIRARLEEGDFQEGDRVVILFENMPAPAGGRGEPIQVQGIRPDTLLVRAGRVLQFPQGRYSGVKDLRIGGLLRSELPDTVRAHMATIFRDPQVRVTSLIALSVTGAVLRAGPVDVPGDMRLNDIFNAAGGLAGEVNMKKSFIRRGGQQIMDGKDLQTALDIGLTIDAAQLRAGDQVYVERKTPSNWLAYTGLVLSVISLIVFLSRGS
jgi:protein involved in polysaccharide export with SLBB domain